MAMDLLGCGDYRVLLTERGGSPTLTEIPWTAVFFGRVLDDASNATVQIPVAGVAQDDACCYALSQLDPFLHEINIYRDGNLAWVGPVIDARYNDNEITISGKDVFSWFDRRIFPHDMSFSNQDLAHIFKEYTKAVLAVENSMGILVQTHDTDTSVTRNVLQKDLKIVGDELRELGRAGLDFTTLGRTIIAGNIQVSRPDALRVWQPSLRTNSTEKRGSELATEVFITGGPPGSQELASGSAGGISSIYGLLQSVRSEGSIDDVISMNVAAEEKLRLVNKVPIFMTVTFSPEAPFGIKDLVPGVICDVRAEVNCLTIYEEMMLQSMSVSAVATTTGGISESIAATIIPIGSDED